MTLSGKNYLAGELSSKGNDYFTSVDPRTRTAGDILFYDAIAEEVDAAAKAAAEAFQETRHYPASKLADFLDIVADEIEAIGDELLTTADMETGLGIPRLTGERGRTTGQLRAFGRLLREGTYVEAIIDTPDPNRQPAPKPDLRRMLVPLGAVAVFSASNFPFAFAVTGGDTASAWAAGCPVVVKAHPGHPATSELFAQAVYRAIEKEGFPKGFFSMIQGKGFEGGVALVEHPAIQAVGFTGSFRGGRALFDIAAKRPQPIPVYAEMGSINPIVILPGAIAKQKDSLVEGLVNSVLLGSGQFCTNPGLVFVLEMPQTFAFIEKVKTLMTERQAGVLLNEKIESGLDHAVNGTVQKESVEVLTGAEVVEGSAYCYANTVMQTTTEAFRDDEELQTEHFGPVTMFVVAKTMSDLKKTLPYLHGNLTSTIHAELEELDEAREIYDLLVEKAGRLIWNGYPTGVEVAHAMHHGGPYPATTAPATTSVGMTAIKRFMRPVAYQNLPDALLPDALKDTNPLDIWRIVDNETTKAAIQK